MLSNDEIHRLRLADLRQEAKDDRLARTVRDRRRRRRLFSRGRHP